MTEKLDQKKVKQIVLTSGTSFYWGMNLLKQEQRRAMFSVYSFCRIVDDIADSDLEKKIKLHELKEWKKKIHLIYANKTEEFLGRELRKAISKYNLRKSDFIDIIEGMEMDITEKIVYPSRKNLQLYCDRVAGAVGCLSMNIFEIKERNSRKYAKLLGRAFQFTNILRDLKEDSIIGRCYIPKELIKKFANINENPAELIKNPGLEFICKELIIETKNYYSLAEDVSKEFDQNKLYAPRLMQGMYKGIFRKICLKNWDFEKKLKLSKVEKLIIIFKAIFKI